MRVVALVSGGKDSCHAMLWCQVEGHEIVALANLQPEGVGEQDSMMFQTVGHEAVHHYASAMALSLYRRRTAAKAIGTDKGYTAASGDEVEDLYLLLKDVLAAHPDVQGVSSGAILSDYQRVRVENVCCRLGLISLSYLWRRDQPSLLREMASSRLHAIIVKVASFGLDKRHLGRSISELKDELISMADSHQLNPCGEGGEFETFVLDSPLFKCPLQLINSEVIVHSDDAFSPVCYLRLQSELGDEKVNFDWKNEMPLKPQRAIDLTQEAPDIIKRAVESTKNVKCDDEEEVEDGGIQFITLSASGEDEESAVRSLDARLHACGLTTGQVIYTWVLLPQMAHYARVNKAYASLFPAQHPPCRACVALPVKRTIIACLAVKNFSVTPNHFMHVQSISHWAPANIGPYSQAVAIKRWLLVSGQIAMRPADLSLASDVDQSLLALRHVQVVITGISPLVQGLSHLAWGICYGTSRDILTHSKACFHDLVCNLIPNCICERWCFVEVPELPKGASVEWQPFMQLSGLNDERGVKIQRFGDVPEMVRETNKVDGHAVWVLCETSAISSIVEGFSENVIVMPVSSILGNCIGAVISLS